MTAQGPTKGDGVAMPPDAAAPPAPSPRRGRKNRRPNRPRHRRSGLGVRLFLVLLAFALIFVGMGLSGRSIALPVWAVAEVEDRLNTALARAMPEAALSLGGMELAVDSDWVPRIGLEDVRLLKPGGQALLSLPDLRLTLDPSALLRGQVRARSLRLVGAEVTVLRDREGRFDLAFGGGGFRPQIHSFADLFDAADALFARPFATSLTAIEAEALTITLQDLRAGRTWQVGDGRLVLENRPGQLAAELGMSLDSGRADPARAVVTVVAEKGARHARITAQVQGVAAQDIAAQAAPLAWAGVLDAPISGRIATTLDEGGIAAMEGRLEFGAGALQPRPEARPIAFDRAGLSFSYDPKLGRVNMTDGSVESPSLRVRASGHSYLTRADGSRIVGALTGELPASFLTQVQFSQVMVDPAGLFQAPVTFSTGALDFRLRLNPFLVEIGQLSLAEDNRRLTASGKIGADARGWQASVDLALNRIAHDKLLALWPVTLLPPTRDWLGRNVLEGMLFDVQAALRIEPGQEPRLHLGYSFADADVLVLPKLPAVKSSYGYATLDGKSYTVVISRGVVTPPDGGPIDVSGSVFAVKDITLKPAIADVTLNARSSLTATLSLLDQPPFHFLTKADKPVRAGDGQARLNMTMSMPLQKKIELPDIDFRLQGTVSGFRSDVLVPGRVITADSLNVSATPAGLSISGPGRIGRTPFDVTYSQSFAPAEKGHSRIEGSVELSPAMAQDFGLGLPEGMITGSGQGQVVIDLTKGAPGRLRLVSDLNRVGLAIPELGWSKAPATRGRLEAEVTLGPAPRVDRLDLVAPGLTTSGSISLKPGGGLDLARFDKVDLDNWLNGAVELRGRGPGKPVGLAMTAGTIDLRRMPGAERRKPAAAGPAAAGSPLSLKLDRLRISEDIALTNFRGNFSLTGGLSGSFRADVNDKAGIEGTVAPAKHGTAVRVQSADAGAAMAAAGVFSGARGGSLDLQLTPRAAAGSYDGLARMRDIRVRNASVLAELLNAISVVGLLEQLNGAGIVFNDAEGEFVLTPEAVELRRASAIGASLGVSMAGVYDSARRQLAMQGVVSPIYMLNGIGAMFTRRGEGVFGFNYSLRGTADAPDVSVNPLSILTPGMFREIFRKAPPALKGTNE